MPNIVISPRISPQALEAAIANKLPNLAPGLKISKVQREVRIGDVGVDIIADVITSLRQPRRLVIEVKASLPPGRVRESLRQLRACAQSIPGAYPMLASAYISPQVQEICRQENTGYLDLAGNCFIQFDGIYIERLVESNPFPVRGRPRSLFTPVSSRLIRALLEAPKRAWKLTELAGEVGVSVGLASKVCSRLIEDGFLGRDGRLLRLAQPALLLDAWRDAYDPSRTGRFTYFSFERDPDRSMTALAAIGADRKWQYAITSFAAASLVAPFVRGVGSVEVYVPDAGAVDEWVKAMDLRPVESGGNIVLLLPYDMGVFYGAQNVEGKSLVGNIQLYLDLSANPGRGREQADFLRKEKLRF
ncbi:MAG: type IV toxin-antitoxin system AbiEi family antitoxin [Candidatus Coatesbacteria bacterium]